MAQQFNALNDKLTDFIQQQKIYFVGTATKDSRVNVSPKGMDSLRVMSPNQVVWLNVTGSGNETAAHVQQQPRMTLMFCAFDGAPLILRLYGTAKVVHRKDPQWQELYGLFNPLPGARQIFVLDIDLVQTSCGMAVPFFDYVEEREQLNEVTAKLGEEGVEQYWIKKNQTSLDGAPTHIVEKSIF
ncbi:pyridoxamine 5'-phosphate oxidase family protein [Thiomicrospira microaerophila]|uniref:pyridoxamine 5'-phosphate oxidase family protein n=1 Tax=Thiomicrospira microaerophila TaxID=406020 RepID=UPI00200FB0F6|nr:pyridoxamine 5'-phosphate oxidase family protein [Thiomicrospira microaerophila]UQB41957.1 pyridoxamine 5'-phosphate oxidase family protein [Thiomicrospira microaerophila]